MCRWCATARRMLLQRRARASLRARMRYRRRERPGFDPQRSCTAHGQASCRRWVCVGGWGGCMYVVCCGRFGASLSLRFVYADCCCRSRSTSPCWQECLCRCTTPYRVMPESAALTPLLSVTSYGMGSNQSEKQQALVRRGLRASVPKRIYTQYQAQRRIGLHRSNKAARANKPHEHPSHSSVTATPAAAAAAAAQAAVLLVQ